MPKPRKFIYRSEADAIRWLLQQPDLPTDFVIRCDNEALCHALQKGRSNIPEANLACLRLCVLRAAGHRIAVKWISTLLNPADAPSRCPLRPGRLFVSPQFATVA